MPRPIAVEGCSLLAAAKSVESALALLNPGFDDQLFIFFQLSGDRQHLIPGFCFKLFRDTADLRQKNEILFAQPVFDSSFDFSQVRSPTRVSLSRPAES